MVDEPQQTFGARVQDDGKVTLGVWAPRVGRLEVRLTQREVPRTRLEPDERGFYSGVVTDARAGDDYVLVLDGECERPDPASRHQPFGVHQASRVVDVSRFQWSDAGFEPRPLDAWVIYELHVGTFSPEGTFDGALRHLDHLVDLGVTAIEVMPVAAFPGNRNWGYDGVQPYAVHHAYGGPEQFARFVDACHRRGISVVLDVVYNHLGPEGNYLGQFAPFFTDRYHTPWGSALNFDGEHSELVRRYFVENALMWIRDYHVDALRLDAIHGIVDTSAVHILEELAIDVHALGRSLGRNVFLFPESDLNDPRVVRSVEHFGYGLDAQWTDDFHHALHAAALGSKKGWFADFGSVEQLAHALRRGWVFEGQRSRFRNRRHGRPATDLGATCFIYFDQNHDQIANAYQGKRLAELAEPALWRSMAGLMLLAPAIPLLFMGEEWGTQRPFHYFTSHGDTGLAQAVREGRRREHEALGDAAFFDPQEQATFDASRLDWSELDQPSHRGHLEYYRALLGLRSQHAAYRRLSRRSWQVTHREPERALFLVWEGPSEQRLLVAVSFARGPCQLPLPAISEPLERLLFSNDPSFSPQGPQTTAPPRRLHGEEPAVLIGPGLVVYGSTDRG